MHNKLVICMFLNNIITVSDRISSYHKPLSTNLNVLQSGVLNDCATVRLELRCLVSEQCEHWQYGAYYRIYWYLRKQFSEQGSSNKSFLNMKIWNVANFEQNLVIWTQRYARLF